MPGMISALIELSAAIQQNIEVSQRILAILQDCQTATEARAPQVCEPALTRTETMREFVPVDTEMDETLDDEARFLFTDDEEIMQRRIEYHKQNGTACAGTGTTEETSSEQSVSAPRVAPRASLTPEEKLANKLKLMTTDERDELSWGILKKAKSVVTDLLNVDPHAAEFEEEVTREADRLLSVWAETA